MVAHLLVSLLPKLREQFAEFLQHHSLKRLGMLYLSTCVGLGYGLVAGAISWKQSPCTPNPYKGIQVSCSVTTRRPRNINRVPIDYGFRPHLRGRLTLRGLTLRRNPWTFGDRVSRPVCRYSCQHSRFRYLQMGSPLILQRPTERSATAQNTTIDVLNPNLRCMALAPLHFRRRTAYLDQ